jgi:hypothetical protein
MVKSKISDLYIGKLIFLHIVAIAIIGISSIYLDNIYYAEKRVIAAILIVGSIIFLISVWRDGKTLQRIAVNELGITIKDFKSATEICFTEIEQINKHAIKSYINGVQISDGYSLSEIIIKEKPSIVISPEKFENYVEIMAAINTYKDAKQFA